MVEYASLFMATKPQSQWNISYFSTNFKVLISEEYFGQRFLALQRSYFWRLNKHSSSRKHYLGDVKETQPKQESKFYEWNTWKYGSFLQAFFFFCEEFQWPRIVPVKDGMDGILIVPHLFSLYVIPTLINYLPEDQKSFCMYGRL